MFIVSIGCPALSGDDFYGPFKYSSAARRWAKRHANTAWHERVRKYLARRTGRQRLATQAERDEVAPFYLRTDFQIIPLIEPGAFQQ